MAAATASKRPFFEPWMFAVSREPCVRGVGCRTPSVEFRESMGVGMKQLAIKFRSWGGKRKGAGREPKGPRAGVPHVPRKQPRRTPAHVTMRICSGRPSLRGSRSFRAIKECLHNGKERFGLRIIHFTVQGNHLHLLVEAEDALSLTRGMKGFSVRMARALNKAH